MNFDIETVWFIGALVAFGIASLLLTVRKTYSNYLNRVLMFCGFANICIGIALSIDFEHAHVGEFLFHVVAPVLFPCCLCLIYRAVAELKRHPASNGWLFGPPLLMFAVCVCFTFIRRNITAELILFNLLNMIVMLRIAWSLTRAEEGGRLFVDMVASCIYLLHAVLIAAVILAHLLHGHFETEFNYSNPRSIINSIAAILADGLIFMLFTLMVSERLNRVLTVQVMRDSLSGLYNRRAFEEIAFRELSGAARTDLPVSLLLIDIDHFKRVNDKYGHLAGDAVLIAATETLRGCLRDEDFLCRWGGDEFCALLPRARNEQAQNVGTRILKAIEDSVFSFDGKLINITVSIGIVTEDGHVMDVSTLVHSADEALYLAKLAGRNRFASAPEIRAYPVQQKESNRQFVADKS